MNFRVPAEYDKKKCLPNSPAGCTVERNPAELEAFHLAYWVIDSGYSALAAVLLLILRALTVGIPSTRKNIAVRPGLFTFCDKQSKHLAGQPPLNGMVYSYDLSDITIPLRTVVQRHQWQILYKHIV